jgi:maleamate amidohydrolase
MNERIWDKFLTERDKAVFAAGGFGARAGFGKRPALLVIDVNWAFCGERPEPILESIKRWRTSCGEESWVALQYIKQLIETAHSKGLPVIYTTGERRPDNWDAGSWRWKSTRSDEASGTIHDDIDGNEIVTLIAPGPKNIVIKKAEAVGFLRDEPGLLSHTARLRQRDRRRDDHFRLRAGYCGRRVQPQLSDDSCGRGLFRSERGQSRRQLV